MPRRIQGTNGAELAAETNGGVAGGKSAIARFINSNGFIWITAAVTCLFWFLKLDFAGIAVLLVAVALVLFLCEDATPVMTCFIMLFFVFSRTSNTFEGKELWTLLLILPLAGFVYNICRFKCKNFTMNGFSFAMLVCLVPWLLQGVGRAGRNPAEAALCAAIALVYAAVYFAVYVCSRRDGKEMTGYIANVLLALGVLICTQIFLTLLRTHDYKFENEMLNLGWGTRNPVAAVLALVMPVPFYFSTKKGKASFLFLLLGFAEYLLILMLQSRGVTLFATLMLPFLMGYSMIRAKNRTANIIVNAAFLIAVAGLAAFKIDVLKNLFERLSESGLDDSGRGLLYEAGIGVFLNNPVFGAGFDYKADIYYVLVGSSNGPVYYHSTPIQILACFGALGGLAYFYLYYWRYRVALTDLDDVKFALLAGMVVFECYCFIDTVYFQPMGYFLMICLSLCMEKGLSHGQTRPLAVGLAEKISVKCKEKIA